MAPAEEEQLRNRLAALVAELLKETPESLARKEALGIMSFEGEVPSFKRVLAFFAELVECDLR